MVHIKIQKGLDIPIKGKPFGNVQSLISSGEAYPQENPQLIALNLAPFEEVKFKLLVKPEEYVKIGQPLAEDKDSPGRFFVAPASGIIKEIRRGLKRRLLDIVIETEKTDNYQIFETISLDRANRQDLIHLMKQAGIFSHIRARPFNFLANPEKTPKCIFVKCLESAPFAPSSELHVKGYEKEFQLGLNILAKLTEGSVHLIYRKGEIFKPFIEAKNVKTHTAEGPHPIANFSVLIHHLNPIHNVEDSIWTLQARDVVQLGYLFMHGKYFIEKIISIAGPGILPDRVGFFKIREGYPITKLISGRLPKGSYRLISGDPLTGQQVDVEDFLGFNDQVFCAIQENFKREFLHFFRLGAHKYSFSKAYLTGHLDQEGREYNFTTNQHGEQRPFIDASLYEKVQPLPIPTMLLVKSLMAEDYELAEKYGLLEVDAEDFALPSFVDPSKIEMGEIVKKGIKQYVRENLT